MEVFTKSAGQTQRLGQKFADNLKGGEVLALVGDLGSGKTTFIQGLARGLGITDRIISPTFILMRTYPTSKGFTLYHLDLYRLSDNVWSEVREMGIEDLIGKEETVVVIEWAERIKEKLPEFVTWISFENLSGDTRKIIVNQK